MSSFKLDLFRRLSIGLDLNGRGLHHLTIPGLTFVEMKSKKHAVFNICFAFSMKEIVNGWMDIFRSISGPSEA